MSVFGIEPVNRESISESVSQELDEPEVAVDQETSAENLAWARAERIGTVTAYQDFVVAYPSSPRVSQVVARLVRLRAEDLGQRESSRAAENDRALENEVERKRKAEAAETERLCREAAAPLSGWHEIYR